VHRLFVPWDASPSDANLGGWLHRTLGYMAPPPFESAGYATWMVWGALPLNRPVSLLGPLGGFYSCFMTGDNGVLMPFYGA